MYSFLMDSDLHTITTIPGFLWFPVVRERRERGEGAEGADDDGRVSERANWQLKGDFDH